MITEIIKLLIAFILGVVVGRLSNRFLKGFGSNDLVLTSIVLIWVLSRIVAMIDRTYTSSPVIDGLMGLIAGYFYKGKILPKIKEIKDAKTKNK